MKKTSSNILIIGATPARFNHDIVINAHHYRSQQLIDSILENNFSITLISIKRGSDQHLYSQKHTDEFTEISLGDKSSGFKSSLQKVITNADSKAVLCFGAGNAMYAIRYLPGKPLWVDFYGDPLIEKIGQDWHNNNEKGTRFVNYILKYVFLHSDKISVCSNSQKALAVGGMIYNGIINYRNFDKNIINVIEYLGLRGSITADLISAKKFEDDKVLIIYNGSINTWTDVTLLSYALNKVLLANKNVEFVQFGQTLIAVQQQKFIENLNSPDYIDRVSFLGKISEEKAAEIYKKASICISADLDILETKYGWRTRFLTAIKEGIVLLSTVGNDLSDLLNENKIGVFTALNDMESFHDKLSELVSDGSKRKQISEMQLRNLQKLIEYQPGLHHLIQWLSNPNKISTDRFSTGIAGYLSFFASWCRWFFFHRLKIY